MSEADQLEKLHQLLAKGALTQAEYDQAKARLLASAPGPGAGLAINRLRRSHRDRWIGGVCGGLGRLTGVAAWIWRACGKSIPVSHTPPILTRSLPGPATVTTPPKPR